MEKIYEENLLIGLLYNELDALDRLEMEYALSMDSMSRKAFYGYQKAIEALPKMALNPQGSTIDAIMAYASA